MHCRITNSIRKGEQGFSLLETLVACIVLLIGVSGLMALFAIAVAKNNNQGTQATRTTEYAQDKMEQLMALSFVDDQSDTRFEQTCLYTNTTAPCPGLSPAGTGLGCGTGTPCAASTYYPGDTVTADVNDGGASSTNLTIGTCANGYYCDYIYESATNLTYVASTNSGARYMRQWQIYVDSTTRLKTITVIVSALQSNEVGYGSAKALLPSTTLISQKTNYY